MDLLSSMLATAIGAVAGSVTGGALEAAGGDLWARLRSLATREGVNTVVLDEAVRRARRELVAADPSGAAEAALRLFERPSPELRAFLELAVEELLFSVRPNRGRLVDHYRRNIGYLALLRREPLPPWGEVEPHVAALLLRVRALAARNPLLATLDLSREQRAHFDEARVARRAAEEVVTLLERIDARLASLYAPSQIAVTLHAEENARIEGSPVNLIVNMYRTLPALSQSDLEQLFRHYRRFLAERYGELGVHAFARQGEPTAVVLADLYVELSATLAPRPSTLIGSSPLPLHDLVRDLPALVLLGEAGSGKSTLVRRLVLALGAGDAGRVFGLDDAWLPIIFPVAAFAAARAANAQLSPIAFLQGWFEAQQEPDYTPLLCCALLAGHALIVFDGLDELPTRAQRVEMRQIIEEFARVWDAPGNRFLVTSRPTGYGDALLDGRRFAHAALQPLNDTQLHRLVRSWSFAAAPTEAAVGPLLDALAASEATQTLARTPLLATLLLFVAGRSAELPARRAPLFRRSIELLADDWGLHRSLSKTPLHEADPRTNEPLGSSLVVGVLGAAALRALKLAGDGALVSDRLHTQLRVVRRDDYDVPAPSLEADVNAFLGAVARSTGLISVDDAGTIRFLHRSFGEYMAGRALVEAYFDQAADYARHYGGQHAWRELLTFAAAEAEPDVAETLLHALIAASADGEERVLPAIVAGAGLVERGDKRLADQTRAAVIAALVKLLNDRATSVALSVEGGLLLGQLGDPRLLDPVAGDAAGLASGVTVPSYWCEISPGTVVHGDERDCGYIEPQLVALEYAYSIGRYPVTNSEFRHFLAANGLTGYDVNHPWWTNEGRGLLPLLGRTTPKYWHDWRCNNPAQPTVGISWHEAVAFCRWITAVGHAQGWLSKQEELRLPLWLEWEHAARGGEGRRYPWGDELPNAERANYSAIALGRPAAVGCFPAGAAHSGALDLAGNVCEWTASPAGTAATLIPLADVGPGQDVALAGSSFSDPASSLVCGAWASANPALENDNRGFRLVRASIQRASPSLEDNC